jgi:multiple sugar transport system substrate-binding protein
MAGNGEAEFWSTPIDRRKLLERAAVTGGAIATAGLLSDRARAALAADAGNVTFYSTQLATVNESEAFRKTILKGFQGNPEAIFSASEAEFNNRVVAEAKAGKGSIDLLGALHGSFSTLEDKNYLLDISDVAKDFTSGKNAIPKNLLTLGKLGTSKQYYIPWMQATYVMVANKKVLPLLPKGANVNRLTYGQVATWAKAIDDKEGARLGFPAGTQGLIHRFFQGFLVPAFSGGVVTTFNTPQAASGWNYMKNVWGNTHPQSITYGFMQDPLLNEEVLLAWDHVARMNTALSQRPDTFVSMPSPTLSAVGFFPVVGGRLSKSVSAGLRAESNAVKLQQTSPKALPALLPIGLGSEGGNFNKVYRDTFTRIVLNKEDWRNVLKSEGAELQGVMDRSGAPCWAPDPPSTGPCKVKGL